MSFESELKAHIAADATITGLIQSRFTPGLIPEGSPKPCSTFQRISGEPRNSLDGFTSGLTLIRLQINHWAGNFDAAREVADAFAVRMRTPAATIKSYLSFDQDDYEPDTKLFRIIQEYSCWHSQ